MREIKFKVIDEQGLLIGYEFWDVNFGWHHTLASDDLMEDGTPPIHNGTIPDGIDRYIRLEFTGLKDKNGVEIYEGDVVNILVDEDSRLPKTPVEIFWWYGQFVFKASNNQPYDYINFGWWIRSNDFKNSLHQIEIIGNIHEEEK